MSRRARRLFSKEFKAKVALCGAAGGAPYFTGRFFSR